MKKFIQITALFIIILLSSCANNTTDKVPAPYWKVVSITTGKVQEKMIPEVKGDFMYEDMKGYANPVYVINDKPYQSGGNFSKDDSVLIIVSIYTADTTGQTKRVELKKLN